MNRKYYLEHRTEILARYREYNHNHRERNWKEHERRRYAKNPEKKLARRKAADNICLVGKCCSVCRTNENLERAHIDYSEPLEVLILCSKHHRLIDRYYKEFD